MNKEFLVQHALVAFLKGEFDSAKESIIAYEKLQEDSPSVLVSGDTLKNLLVSALIAREEASCR